MKHPFIFFLLDILMILGYALVHFTTGVRRFFTPRRARATGRALASTNDRDGIQ